MRSGHAENTGKLNDSSNSDKQPSGILVTPCVRFSRFFRLVHDFSPA